jgi:beta-glucanase (GH16 family)
MRSRISLLFSLVFVTQISWAQNSGGLIDFSSHLDVFETFLGASFQLKTDPTDPSNTFGEITNTGNAWEGMYLDLPSNAVLDSNKIIQLDFYQSGGTNEVLVKLESGLQTPVEVKKNVNGSGWISVSFDFSQAQHPGSPNTVNASGSFDRLVLFVNGASTTTGSYGFDNISYPNFGSVHQLDVVYQDLVYADEFDTDGAVNSSDWFQEIVPPNSWGWHNGEFQHYTNRLDNSYVQDGKLHIVAKRETYNAYGVTLDYTSARLNSKFSFTYGRVDVRAKLPRGVGTWPAIWMLGLSHGNHWNPFVKPWPDCGEIDIIEHWGIDSGRVQSALHNLSSNGATVNKGAYPLPTVSDSFHVYSLNWSPNEMAFMVDDEVFYVYNPPVKNAATWPYDDPQFMILNVAMGSAWHTIDPNFQQSKMEVDYVRVYQNTVGAEEPKAIGARVFPQPASNYIQLEGTACTEFSLYDMQGKLVLQEEWSGSKDPQIEIAHLAQGMYQWTARIQGRVHEGKLQIVRP